VVGVAGSASHMIVSLVITSASTVTLEWAQTSTKAGTGPETSLKAYNQTLTSI